MAHKAVTERGASIRLACAAFEISETCYRYQPKLSAENAQIADWLIRLTTNQRNWGFGLCYLYLRNVKGFGWNRKRVLITARLPQANLASPNSSFTYPHDRAATHARLRPI